MKPAVRVIALAAMTGALCTSTAVFAEDAAKSPAPKASNAMRVVVDSETGQLRAPTPEELRAQLARENASAANTRSARAAAPATSAVLPSEKSVKRHANGMVSVKMSQESLSALKTTTDANGKTIVEHEGDSTQPVATEE
jgi:hypothetical protein